MDSGVSSSKSGTALMPALAILRHELGSLWSGWLVRLVADRRRIVGPADAGRRLGANSRRPS